MSPQVPEDATGQGPDPDELGEPSLEAPLLSGLAEVFPGFELYDSDLEFDRPHRIHYVGVDGAGRLTLVLRVRGEGHSAILRALDARDFARRHLAPLLKHLGARRARPELEPRVALVATDYDERLRRRLEGLGSSGIEAFELRRLRSHSGELVFLTPLSSGAAPSPSAAPSLDDWLGSLPLERREAVSELIQRLERLDENLELEHERHGLSWRLGDRVVASLELDPDGGARLVAPGRPPRRWRGARDTDHFLEDVVSDYLARREIASLRTVELRPEPTPGSKAAAAAAPARAAAAGEPARPRGLLSAEELEAFGD